MYFSIRSISLHFFILSLFFLIPLCLQIFPEQKKCTTIYPWLNSWFFYFSFSILLWFCLFKREAFCRDLVFDQQFSLKYSLRAFVTGSKMILINSRICDKHVTVNQKLIQALFQISPTKREGEKKSNLRFYGLSFNHQSNEEAGMRGDFALKLWGSQ